MNNKKEVLESYQDDSELESEEIYHLLMMFVMGQK